MVGTPLSLLWFVSWLLSVSRVKSDDNFGGLILTPFIRNGSTDLARNLAKVDPTNFQGLESYSAFMTVNEKYNSNIFFWYFPHAAAKDVPWIIWLQGGPGFSSLFGLFDGIGPLKVEGGKVSLQDFTWASNYSLLFVDNPVGAGFSYTTDEAGYTSNEDDMKVKHPKREEFRATRPHVNTKTGDDEINFSKKMTRIRKKIFDNSESDEDKIIKISVNKPNRGHGMDGSSDKVGEQLLKFLVQFLEVFPELRRAPLFLAGESYSGKYLPAFGAYIHRHLNKELVNFRGISIGNGLIDPRSQLAEGHTQLCSLLGLLEDKELATLKEIQQELVKFIDQERMIDAANKFNESVEFIKAKSGVNIYNFNDDPKSVAPEFEGFIKSPQARKWIHVGRTPFNFNNQHVYYTMLPDIMNSTKPFLEELLDHYGVMCYSGQLDVILPYALAKPMHAQLKWSLREEHDRAPRKRMRNSESGAVVAYRKSGGNFVEVIIRRAGHMVPAEQPEVCKFVVDTFITEFK